MSEGLEGCAVCGGRAAQGARMSKVVVEGRALDLCRAHAATVVNAMPETFDDLRELFIGAGVDLGTGARRNPAERRSPVDRRAAEDRRVFPPRPEGRRLLTSGRRAGDPLD
jgi:hypothetical protein